MHINPGCCHIHILMMMLMIKKTLIINTSIIWTDSQQLKLVKNAACDARWQICVLSLDAKKKRTSKPKQPDHQWSMPISWHKH